MAVGEVRIEFKKGVVDAEGGSVQKALKLLGFGVEKVETVKVYRIKLKKEGEEARKELEEACKKLLANPVINNYTITIL